MDCLNNSIRANPASSEALFARGRAYQRLGEYSTAFRDYDAASQLTSSATLHACKGYCLSQMKYHKQALTADRLALEADYDSPALLYNNIGYGYLMLGQIGEAEEYLQRAVQLDDGLGAAHHCLVRLFLLGALEGGPFPRRHLAMRPGPSRSDLTRPSCSTTWLRCTQRRPSGTPTSFSRRLSMSERPLSLASSPKHSLRTWSSRPSRRRRPFSMPCTGHAWLRSRRGRPC